MIKYVTIMCKDNIEHTDKCCCCHGECDDSKFLRGFGSEALSLVMLLAGMLAGHFGWWDAIGSALGGDVRLPELCYYLVAIWPVGYKVVVSTIKSWSHGDFFNEFSLMTLACVGAFVIGEYPEAVAIMLFYSFGEKLEDSASDTARDRIRSLIARMPNEVTVEMPDGSRATQSPEAVEPGSVLVVRPGERVALDGELIGTDPVDVDASAITGESVPVSVDAGSAVASGVIPVDREIHVRVTRRYNDSSMSRLLKMIEEAAAKKSSTETLLRRITRWYTPVVFGAAVLLFVVPALLSAVSGYVFEWNVWLERSLVLLVCSCPCALVVSIPLSYYAAIGNASRFGILFKGSRYLDQLRNIDTLLLDKTGTVTTGAFSVVGVEPVAGHMADEVLAMAAALDKGSAHPLAKAIVAQAVEKGVVMPDVADVRTVPHGMAGVSGNGAELLAGSRRLLDSRGIASDAVADRGTQVCVAVGGKYIGSIFLEDTLKPDIADTMNRLRSVGVSHIEIMSGDTRAAVARGAERTGIDGYRAEMLPADKQAAVMQLKEAGRRVAFVGDGINDAPSLAAADVGIAIGTGGTDVAIESADAVITGHDLRRMVDAVKLSRRIKHVVALNVGLAIGVKALVMILGACGIATLWAAVFADTGITLITIIITLIALRTTKK